MPENGEDTFTEIVCVIDRSGSMDSIKNDAIGGFNAFLKEQQSLPGEAAMTIVMFDHEYLVPYSGVPIQNIKPLDDSSYIPRGTTALNDAIGRAVSELKCRNPKKAIILILTDGHENASHEFNKSQIKEMMKECEDRGWFVSYLSVTLDAFDDARSYGIGRGQTASYSNTGNGIFCMMATASQATSDYRGGGTACMTNMASYSASASNLVIQGWGTSTTGSVPTTTTDYLNVQSDIGSVSDSSKKKRRGYP